MQLHGTASASDRLMMTLFLAGVLHALVILGISFTPEPEKKIEKPLKIALIIPAEEEEKPEQADFYAEQDSVGSGENEEAEIPKTMGALTPPTEVNDTQETQPTPPAPPPAEQPHPIPKPTVTTETAPEPQPPEKTEEASKPEPKAVITQEKAPVKTKQPQVADATHDSADKTDTTTTEKKVPKLNAATLHQQIAQLGAELSVIKQTRAKRPIIKYINSVNAHKYKAAAYERAWQEKVERIGNLNYPDEARRKSLSGTLILAVGIRKDGTIATMKIRHSSKHQALDDAAKQIVRLASPFAPFPDGLKDEADILVITRTWKFFSDAHMATD